MAHQADKQEIEEAQKVIRTIRKAAILIACVGLVLLLILAYASTGRTNANTDEWSWLNMPWLQDKCSGTLRFTAPVGEEFSSYYLLPGVAGCKIRMRWNGRVTLQFGEPSGPDFTEFPCILSTKMSNPTIRSPSVRARSCEKVPVEVAFIGD